MENQLEFEPATSNFLDEGFSNLKGKFRAKRKAKKALKAVCGRKPLLKKKRGDYDKCVAEYKANDGGASKEKTETTTPTTEATATEPKKDITATTTDVKTDVKTDTKPDETKGGGTSPATDTKGVGAGDGDEKKILGMKPMVAYGVFALVAVGVGLLIWKMSSKGTPAAATA
jgi:hypothetical protein